jgi:uncharacterized protein (TIGR00255 family)
MTGFGSARRDADGQRLDVEVRAVNHRSLKVGVRVPEGLLSLIPRLEELVRARLARGSVHCVVRHGRDREEGAWQLDRGLLERFHGELTRAAMDLAVDAPSLGEVAALPGVVRQEETELQADAVWPGLEEAAREALDALEVMRRREGEGLHADFTRLADELVRLADAIEARAPEASRAEAERLRGRVRLLLAGAPGSLGEAPELAREVALLTERTDISEEVQRLRSHVGQLRDALGSNAPVGRKLEFLAQELLREANTMASKSHDLDLKQHVLDLKLAVDRIKEQAANVE